MKRSLSKASVFTAVLCILLLFCACAGEREAVFTRDMELDGFTMSETLTFNARGDAIYQFTENIKLDLSEFSENETAELVDIFRSSITDVYASIDGITCTDDLSDGVYTINAVIPVNSGTLGKLADTGLMEFTGSSERLSLSVTEKSLTESGYTKV